MKSLRDRFMDKVRKQPNGCWLWAAHKIWGGYGRIAIDGVPVLAHRASWELQNGAIPDGLWVLHKCDVRSCVNPEHLFLGSRKDNIDDAVEKLRHAVGERHACAKLTESDVLHIRSSTEQSRILAKQLGVHETTICNVRKRRIWRHI